MFSSLVTPSAKLDANNWGVTLVCDEGSNHARLIFECVKTDIFIRIAELKGIAENDFMSRISLISPRKVGFVKIVEIKKEDFKPKFAKKTETWIVTRNKIERLIENIEIEANKDYPFIILGDKSIFEKNAEVYLIQNELLKEIRCKNSNLFLRLYDSVQNEEKCTGMSLVEFNQTIKSTISEIEKEKPDLVSGEYDYARLVELVKEDNVKQIILNQQNCFTWARSHLFSIGIKLENNFLDEYIDKVFSITRRYAIHKRQEAGNVITINSEELPKTFEKSFDRHVTYKTNRDKRTESYKAASSEVKKKEIATIAGAVSIPLGAIGMAVGEGIGIAAFGFGVTVLSPVVLPVAGAVCVIGGLAVLGGGAYAVAKSNFDFLDIKKPENIENKKKEITAIEHIKYEHQIKSLKL